MTREDYEWFKDRNICTQCRKEISYLGKTMCIECLDKIKEMSEKYRSKDSKEQRKKYLKRKRGLCVAFGICRECLKRKATVGLKCTECHIKEVKRNNAKRIKVKRNMRVELGLCYFCGEKALEGYKVCKTHLEICRNNIGKWKRDNSNHYWRKIQSGEVKKIQHWKLKKGVSPC